MTLLKEEMALKQDRQRFEQVMYPMHPAQNEVLRAQLINEGSPFYNIGAYVKLKGPLCKTAFIRAARSAPAVFDAFRMRFAVTEAGAACFFEDTYLTLEIKELDFSHCPNPAEEARSWVQERFTVAFDVEKESRLFENLLITITPEEHWFFMRYHHLVMDGYGFKVWLQYLATTYKYTTTGEAALLRYPTYAAEIRKANEHRNSPDYQRESLYWRERINEKPKRLLQRRYQHQPSRSSSTYSHPLSDGQRKMLQGLQAKSKTSIQHLTIAALSIYFGKITPERDFVFGILLHKRESREMRNVVGMFSDVLPFKIRFQPENKLVDFLKEITLQQKKDYRHKNYMAGDISRHLRLQPADEDLCEIVVNYESFHFELDFGDALTAAVMQLSSNEERIPLQICWQDFGNQQPLQLQLLFRNDFFTEKEIELLAQRLLFILEQFSFRFDAEIESIEIVPFEERQRLDAFNPPATPFYDNENLVSLFEKQVTKTPHKTAVVYDENQLTYHQLNEKANQLANWLHQNEIREETLVPICIERSIEMIIGILGILKSGATYVPIDPAYPPDRIRYILDDTKARLVLTSTLSKSKLPAADNIDYIDINKAHYLIAEQSAANLKLEISTASLAYIMYTSGSTGRPKGVQMPGSNLVNLLFWQEEQFAYPNRRVLQFACLNFDVSFQEIFSTLCFGGTLYLINERCRGNMQVLSDVIHRFDITHLFLPYIVLKSLAEHTTAGERRQLSLKTIVVAGEQLKLTNDINQFLNDGGITLINQYGPTEAHVVSSFTIHPHNPTPLLPPIGKPINQTGIYICDSQLRLLPLGVAGEICITGAGVAKGYLHQQELTKEKFIGNPFGEGTMYRTGDIGRWLPDGNLEYLGRVDDQVKIRGYRVETGEIETVLHQYNAVRQCVITTKDNGKGTKQLICYVVLKKPVERDAIMSYLEKKLPGYMIPSLIVVLPSIPVTATGKVDKKALPAPEDIMSHGFVAPTTDTEANLVRIWQEVLEIEKVGIQDDFFELGGHSLLVVKTIAKIKKQTGRNVSPGSLFQYPTVEKYARYLLEKDPTEATKYIVPIKSGGDDLPLYMVCPIDLSPLGRFIPFADLLEDTRPIYGIQLTTVDELDHATASVESIATQYVADLVEFDPEGPYALAGYSIGGLIAFEMAKQLEAMGKKIKFLCLFDTIAYTANASPPPVPANSFYRVASSFISRLKKLALDFYFSIDNDLYLLRYDTRNLLRRKKHRFGKFVKKLLNKELVLPQQPESRLHWENMQTSVVKAYKEYRLTPYNGDIVLFRARRRTIHFGDPVYLGWKPFAKAVKVFVTEGNHYTMFNQPHREQLAKLMQQCLNEYTSRVIR